MTSIPTALRAFAVPVDQRPHRPRSRHLLAAAEPFAWPELIVIDTETTTDPTQALQFGCYGRYTFRNWELVCLEEGIFFPDDWVRSDLPAMRVLRQYVRTHTAAVAAGENPRLRLLSRHFFIDRLLRAVTEAEALVVGFNLPFDLTRIAVHAGAARHPVFRGGFSLEVGQWIRDGVPTSHAYRPRVFLKTIDAKRALMGLSGIKGAGPKTKYPGWPFLDLRTLAFALTGKGMSLQSAGEYFGAAVRKSAATEHGIVTDEYVDYCRQDVRATASLLERLRHEFDRHPIPLAPTAAFSPASVGKGYLAAAGIQPPAQQFADLAPEFHGIAMAAYYGGRAESRIRKTSVPVRLVDFLSMYTTVNALMGLWTLLTAEALTTEDVTDEVRAMAGQLRLDHVMDPAFWRSLCCFVLVEPDDDIFPLRAWYGPQATPGIGVNHVRAEGGLWYAAPDIVAATLLGGRAPMIRAALRLVPHGRQDTLLPVAFRGEITIDPRKQDVFRRVIEARAQVKRDRRRTPTDRDGLQLALKILANSAGYGIFAELNPQEVPADERPAVRVYGLGPSFVAPAATPEALGEYCFPPFASLTTAGARLMLALLETLVSERGGTYAFCDTDSMAIVATPSGGLVPCPGGTEALDDGSPTVRALPYAEVEAIREQFVALNPYSRRYVPGSILEVEMAEGDAAQQSPLHALVISPKRYALFGLTASGTPVIRKVSEHGLGHLLDPLAPEAPRHHPSVGAPVWIVELWEWLVRRELGLEAPEPPWFDMPAVSQVTISTPSLYRSLDHLNRDRAYADHIKPANFVLCAYVAPFGHPVGVDPEHFHLIAPHERDAARWLTLPWFDKYSGTQWPVTTDEVAPPDHARLATYRDVAERYAVHPDPKSAGSDGRPCTKKTRGLLRRRHVRVGSVRYVGKESNRVDDVEHGLVHRLDEVLAVYEDPAADPWHHAIMPILKRGTAEMWARATKCSSRTIKRLRNGVCDPSPRNRRAIVRAVQQWAQRQLARRHQDPERVELARRLQASSLGAEPD